MVEQTNLLVCQLVSRGLTVAQAKEKLGLTAPKVAEPDKEEAPESTNSTELETVQSELTKLGIKFHPNSKLETLQKKLNLAIGDGEDLV